jgi:uncharacterized protein
MSPFMRLRILWPLFFLAAAPLALDAFWMEPSSLRLARTDIPLDAPALKGLRIAVIADLHAGAPFIDAAKIDRVVAMTNAARPDLILLVGDYVIQEVIGGHHMPIEEIAAHLKPLHAPLGVYAVIGNHDRWEDATHITAVIRAAGIPVLENASIRIPLLHGPLILVGVGDHRSDSTNAARAMKGVAADAQALCFTHSPDAFPELPKSCALTIAGHTHGGQVWLPLLGRPAVPHESLYGQRYAIGTIRENGKTLFVSPGIGTSGLAVRFMVPPEISFLTIR